MRDAIDAALAADDFRWAIEMASWLVRYECNARGRADAGCARRPPSLGTALRGVAYATTSANVRNWSLTRALELDGSSNLERFRTHRFQKRELARRPAVESVGLLRVLLLPERAGDMEQTLRVMFTDGGDVSLTIRHGVAVPGNRRDASMTLSVASDHWFDLMAGKLSLSQALAEGLAEVSDAADVQSFLRCFDLEH